MNGVTCAAKTLFPCRSLNHDVLCVASSAVRGRNPLLASREAKLDPANDPGQREDEEHAAEDDQRLAQRRRDRVLVRDCDFTIPQVVDKVARLEGDSSTSESVEIGVVNINRRLGEAGAGQVREQLDVPGSMG